MKIHFRFDTRCPNHPRTEPEVNMRKCESCEALHVIKLYVGIAARKAEKVFGIRPLQQALKEHKGDA